MDKRKKIETKRINLFMPMHLYEFAKSEADKTGLSFTGYINLLVKQASREEKTINMAMMLKELKEGIEKEK